MNTEDQNSPNKDPMAVFLEHLVEEVSNEVIRKQSKKKVPHGDPSYKNDQILWGDNSCPIERGTTLNFICEFLFKTPKGKYVSWDVAYEALEGKDSEPSDWRKIYDAVKGLNEKTIENFEVPIFHWKNKEIARLY